MKLYLSSFKIGNETQVLKEWIAYNNNKICLIFNALDQYPDSERKTEIIAENADQLSEVGFICTLLDLRDYFGKAAELREFLKDYKAVYVLGGNTFILRRAMKLSGFDDYLKGVISDPAYLYAGYSAGICVLTKDLECLAMVDDPEIDPYNYGSIIYEGLGFLNYVPLPHFESDHPETALVTACRDHCVENNIPYKTLRDGEVIIQEI